MASKIYTRKGDCGQTGLVGGQEVHKSECRIETYGTVDELNVFMGKLVVSLKNTRGWIKNEDGIQEQVSFLESLQSQLFNIGSLLACIQEDREKFKLPDLQEKQVKDIEKQIDKMSEILPPLKNFILPGGSEAASDSHLCRVMCRRLERLLASYMQEGGDLPHMALPFVNRLSDYFFVAARFFNYNLGIKDITWSNS